MFDPGGRDAIAEHVLTMARADPRIVAAAVVGSLAQGEGDRWSDIDLTFGVADGIDVAIVLEEWTQRIVDDLDAVVLFDLHVEAITYRVFLLAHGQQLDLSFSPGSELRATSTRFRLLFGTAAPAEPPPPSSSDLLGWAVMWARFAVVCIRRGRLWQAEYSITSLRHNALALACVAHGLPAGHGRGFHQLPTDVLDGVDATLVRSLDPGELSRALTASVAVLDKVIADDADPRIRGRLDELVAES